MYIPMYVWMYLCVGRCLSVCGSVCLSLSESISKTIIYSVTPCMCVRMYVSLCISRLYAVRSLRFDNAIRSDSAVPAPHHTCMHASIACMRVPTHTCCFRVAAPDKCPHHSHMVRPPTTQAPQTHLGTRPEAPHQPRTHQVRTGQPRPAQARPDTEDQQTKRLGRSACGVWGSPAYRILCKNNVILRITHNNTYKHTERHINTHTHIHIHTDTYTIYR